MQPRLWVWRGGSPVTVKGRAGFVTAQLTYTGVKASEDDAERSLIAAGGEHIVEFWLSLGGEAGSYLDYLQTFVGHEQVEVACAG